MYFCNVVFNNGKSLFVFTKLDNISMKHLQSFFYKD